MVRKANINIARMSVFFITATLLIQPALSYAERGERPDDHRDYRYHDHPHFGLHVSFIPDGFVTVAVGGIRCYYYDGLYYNRIGGEYVIINPPIGAVVRSIPPDYRPVVIDRVTYYVDSDTYYVYTPHGYQVVPAPVTVAQVSPQPMVVAQPSQVQAITQAAPADVQPQASERETVTINVPNSNGSFIPITLLKSNNGYIGPQGEFYEGHPTVKQLKALYGK